MSSAMGSTSGSFTWKVRMILFGLLYILLLHVLMIYYHFLFQSNNALFLLINDLDFFSLASCNALQIL